MSAPPGVASLALIEAVLRENFRLALDDGWQHEALGALGLATAGINGATAVVNCDLGTGIRMAAPIAMLSSLTLSAEHGILVKDGRALESLH